MLYEIVRNLLFQIDAEKAHNLGLKGMRLSHALGTLELLRGTIKALPKNVMGIDFKNPVGLAAGLDKNGESIDALGALGFGFLELGTVTPRPQPGNPKPRLFRIKESEAIVNRMGFNNKGIDHLLSKVAKAKFDGVIGINIGKNFDTPNEKAVNDYLVCLQKAYEFATYIAVNISSPNTKGLRDLQGGDEFANLLSALKEEQIKLSKKFGKYKPIAVKIAPDLENEQLEIIAQQLLKHEIDGVIATNTTITRTGVENSIAAKETGGLSGKPLKSKSTEIIRKLAIELGGTIPIIGVGGISSGLDAMEKLNAGASLIQIYSGFIYKGPHLIKEIVEFLSQENPS